MIPSFSPISYVSASIIIRGMPAFAVLSVICFFVLSDAELDITTATGLGDLFFTAVITVSTPGTTPPALLQSPDRDSIFCVTASISVYLFCRFRFAYLNLMLEDIVKLVRYFHLKASGYPAQLSRFFEAGTTGTNICPSARFLSGEIK